MVEVDRLMVDVFGIELIQMMENAGRHLAALAKDRFLEGDPADKHVVVLAGSGGNGGGALAAARNLFNWGARVEVYLARSIDQLEGVVLRQAKILQSLGLELKRSADLKADAHPRLIIDGIIGYSLKGSPRGPSAEMINWANSQGRAVLSLDLPSGLDATSGEVYSPVIWADATMTLALPKAGLKSPGADVVGDLYLADIGVPPILYQQPTLALDIGPIFHHQQIIRLN
jgi:NAD(P)H-hydrate epimerase